VRHDLRLVGRPLERHAVDKLATALVGLAVPNAVGLLLTIAGSRAPLGALASAGLLFAVVGFFVPDLLLRDEVKRRRDGFRHALSAYLDLVNVLLAGSAGTETALAAAAEAGDGWAFAEIRACLDRARVMRTSPWDALAALGSELGVDELLELAASVRLAGEQGARIKSSLAAKAAALRGHQLARTEAAAQAASDKMALPNVLMFLGFIVFVGYPAFVSIVGS
jgi:tight adherence protein C